MYIWLLSNLMQHRSIEALGGKRLNARLTGYRRMSILVISSDSSQLNGCHVA